MASANSFPAEVGCFSVDSHGNYLNDRSLLKPLIDRKTGFNLNDGFEDRYITYMEDRISGWECLLRWRIVNGDKEDNGKGEKISRPDFVISRGVMVKIMHQPWNEKFPWKIGIQKRNGVIYIRQLSQLQHESSDNFIKRGPGYWGERFETYMTTSPPETDATSVTNRNQGFYTVLSQNLDNFQILYSAEVDCFDPESSLSPPENYFELKTSSNEVIFSKYSFKTWAQSFLAGVPIIVVGFCYKGVIKEIKRYATESLRFLPDSQAYGKTEKSINVLKKFFRILSQKRLVENQIWALRSEDLYFLNKNLIDLVLTREENITVIPDWYNDV